MFVPARWASITALTSARLHARIPPLYNTPPASAHRARYAEKPREERVHGRGVIGADQHRPARDGIISQLDLDAEVAGEVRQDALRAGEANRVGTSFYARVPAVLIKQRVDGLVDVGNRDKAVA